mmetsp:Transcript_10321/g.24332  ORF Transcript_10321/g.24332 Transcript_10321/m.24332 type:complete len:291 (-) Transcript_10321:104-976(-)
MKCFMFAWLFALCLAEEWEVVHLLQQRVVVQQKTLPMYWVHFPKAGSSFVNVLVQQPGFCRLGQDMLVDEEHLGQCFLTKFMDLCWEKCDPQHLQCSEHVHECLGTKFFEVEGRMVGMFRQPEQRLLSMYYDEQHNFFNYSFCGERSQPNPPLSVYKEMAAGMATLMLTVDCDLVEHQFYKFPPCTRSMAEEAVRRVSGFAFVGITEEWDLSVCLFHAMFGGACHAGEFENVRPGPEMKTKWGYDTSVLEGFRDEFDGMVYQEALKIFRQNALLHNVSLESCQPCFEARP